MKTYPTLYSRASTGNVQVWYMIQEYNKYKTVSGIIDGKKVESEWTVCLGKNQGKANETSGEQQATKEVEARYKKQLEQNSYFLDIKDIDNKGVFNPMLAKNWEDRQDEIDWSNGVYVSPKMDGLRAIITKDGASSRNGKPFVSFPHIFKALEGVFSVLPDLILDGEIYCDKLSNDFNKIISLAKKTKPTADDLIESEKYLQYWVFDCPSFGGTFKERYNKLVILFSTWFKDNKYIKLCEHKLIKTPDEIESNLQEYINQGFEGLMVNTCDGIYEEKRSNNLLKYKLFVDNEYPIVSITEGKGNRSGMFGYATLKIGDKTFDSNARGDEEYYKELLTRQSELVGKMATVRYQNLTPDGIPRFPVIVGIRDYE